MLRKNYVYLVAFVLISIFLGITTFYSQNFPYNDDFPTILDFLSDYLSADSIGDKLSLMIAPYGEHRIFFIRMITLLEYGIFNTLDFRHFIFLGNISYVVFSLLVIKKYVKTTGNLLAIIPVVFLFFQLQSWSNHIWAMASMENTLIFCWVALSFYFAYEKRNNTGFAWSIVFGLFATYTNGNGIFVFLISGLLFLLNKEWKKGGITSSLFVVLFMLNNTRQSDSLLTETNSINITGSIAKFFAFSGSNLFHPTYYMVAVAGGAIFFIYFCYLFFIKRYYKQNMFFCALFIFVFLTAFAVVIQRSTLDIHDIAPSRYRVYGTLLLVLTYLSFSEMFVTYKHRQRLSYLVIPGALLFWGFSNYVGVDKIKNRYQLNEATAFMYENGIFVDSAYGNIYDKAHAEGFFSTLNVQPQQLKNKEQGDKVVMNAGPVSPVYGFDTVIKSSNFLIVKGWAALDDHNNSLNKPYIIAHKGNDKTFLRSNFIEVFRFINDSANRRYATSGYLAVIEDYTQWDSLQVAISRDIKETTVIPVVKVPL